MLLNGAPVSTFNLQPNIYSISFPESNIATKGDIFALKSIQIDSILSITIKFWPTWWRHQMETFSTLLAFRAGNSAVPGEFPSQRPVTRSFNVFFDLHLNKQLSKQSRSWCFETPSCPLWCQRITSVSVVQSFWNIAQSTAVSLPWPVSKLLGNCAISYGQAAFHEVCFSKMTFEWISKIAEPQAYAEPTLNPTGTGMISLPSQQRIKGCYQGY